MQPAYPPAFTREHGCTEAEWLGWLPGACAPAGLALGAPGQAQVHLSPGMLWLRWEVLPPRQIALMRMPRMRVHYSFEQVDDGARHAFMRHFDLYMQRGGG
jgi:hypothetical protein